MKKLVLILLCIVTFNGVFGSSKNLSKKEDYYYTALGAIATVIDSNESAELRQEAEEGLVRFCNKFPEFREQAMNVYNEQMEEIKNDGNTKAMTELKRIGYKLGFEQEQQPSTSTTGSGKSSCCLLL